MKNRHGRNGADIRTAENRIQCELGKLTPDDRLITAFRMAEIARERGQEMKINGATDEIHQILYLAARKAGVPVESVPPAALHISRELWECAERLWDQYRAEQERATQPPAQTGPPGQPPALYELDALIGLESVKRQMHQRVAGIRNTQRRLAQGLRTASMSHHLVFTGSPGTGKTTVARLIGTIYQELGILKKGHVVEVGRSDLVGAYIGHTEKKTSAVIKQARHGVLFIDEAYALTKADSKRDFGKETIETLLTAMENRREELVVIAAGYTDEMQTFLKSNPGLASRFKTIVPFPDYSPYELVEILKHLCTENHYTLSTPAMRQARAIFDRLYEGRDRTFANGRVARNFFEMATQNQADRLGRSMTEPGREALMRLEPTDLPEPGALI